MINVFSANTGNTFKKKRDELKTIPCLFTIPPGVLLVLASSCTASKNKKLNLK